jgi:hypothetical protein
MVAVGAAKAMKTLASNDLFTVPSSKVTTGPN